MPYDFFFSYTRGNYSPFLQAFFDDLCVELREQRGLPRGTVVGFFDQHDIETGAEWAEVIKDALQQSMVMVCIYSPGYFKSPYCGKEWWVFQERREEYVRVRRAAKEPNVRLPPVIKPVFWMAPLPTMTEAVGATQYLWGDPAAEHNKYGLKYVLQKRQEYEIFYADYIRNLATKIREAADEHPLPSLPSLPSLEMVPSAWDARQAVASATPVPAVPAPGVGTKRVKFIYVAADPAAFAGQRQPEPYHQNGGPDWKPFYPQPRRIGTLVQNIVSHDDLDFESEGVTLSNNDDLVKEVEKAYDERKIVIILVDGWSMKCKPEYQTILRHFDENLLPKYINYSVLVPWNKDDPENANRQEEINELVKDTLRFRAVDIANPLYYRDSISTVEELRASLSEILIKIKAEMHRRVEGVKSPPGHLAKPVVSNQTPSA